LEIEEEEEEDLRPIAIFFWEEESKS